MVEVGDFRVIEWQQAIFMDEGFDHVGGWDQQVIAGGTGGELGVHCLVRIECVDLEFAGIFLFELGSELGGQIISPRVNAESGLVCLVAGW